MVPIQHFVAKILIPICYFTYTRKWKNCRIRSKTTFLPTVELSHQLQVLSMETPGRNYQNAILCRLTVVVVHALRKGAYRLDSSGDANVGLATKTNCAKPEQSNAGRII